MDFQCVFWNGRTEKHQTSTAVFLAGWKNWVTQPLPRSLCAVSTSTPKPRAEGSSPSAPATKPAETLGFRRFSFCMCCMVMWCTLVRTLGFLPLVLFVPNRPHPLQHPKRTRLRLFSHELGCVSLFLLVFGRKIFDIFFVHSADMVHKSKSLVIPLSRDVSFLT